ncbi:MAG: methylmalonyl Co-A mutase-associated GTPase MeaB [Thermomicrobiales bacterium]|nr:MAG: methylmalonyl Co-A mutase-associated GTPase MeaB [Thermomicrobiales bacterium]
MSLVEEALRGNQRALARLITAIERDTEFGRAAAAELYARTGQAHIVGITGPPGTGKSTLVSALIPAARRRGKRVGVIAIDPTSPVSGGAVLGDRVRMLQWQSDEGVFIRSMASRGRRGGIAPATSGVIHTLDAAGFDLILVETVGVGQEDIDITGVAHTVVLVQMPRSGDAIQFLKAGILELADILIVNKADLPGADETTRGLWALVAMHNGESLSWRPPVLRCVATTGEGADEVLAALEAHYTSLVESGELARRQERIAAAEIRDAVIGATERHLFTASPDVTRMVQAVAQRRICPGAAADRLIASLGRRA